MTYAASEISTVEGQPIELYQLRLRDTTTYWRWSSAAYDVEYDGETFVATPGLQRSNFEEGDDPLKTELKVTLPTSNAFSELFIYYTPDGIIDVTIFRGHGTDFVQYWDGILKMVTPIDSDGYAKILCVPHINSLAAPFNIRTYDRLCDVPLYGTACALSRALFAATIAVTSVSGTVITTGSIASYATDYFNGGYVDMNGYKRKIIDSTTNTLTLIRAVPGLAAGMSGNAYPGCNHSMSICISKFNNLPNYRGSDYIPNEEPFTTQTLQTSMYYKG